ncbi:hypothetical protein [uncultured Brevundimonas sp.]|uniref:hypothetical protein n=1 Tax=uncultured Brevundimonas sp. TaxID=213418 RepID=UPI0026194ADA|nr:hypothetical protein [uncultured Brevundimonas sp.]
MSIKAYKVARVSLALLALAGAGSLAACSTTGTGAMPVASSAFNRADFEWSSAAGQGGINGVVASAQDGVAFSCVASAGLTPATRFTDARMRTLYGATNRAVLPADVVRARTVSDPHEDYREFVRSTACEDNRFTFSGLPDGRYYLIVPVRAGDAPVHVLMQQVQIRGGRTVNLSL